MASHNGRVSEATFKVINGVFFGIAIAAAIARVGIRIRLRMKLRLDDYLLLSSCVFLGAATGLIFYGTSTIFLAAALTFDPGAIFKAGVNQAEMLQKVELISKIDWAYLTLSWVCIFLIKFGFLSLFRHLVDRLPAIYKFWKGALVSTGLVAAFAICDGFIACPKIGIEAAQCAATSKALDKSLALGATTIVLDMLTDLMILMIPVWLLWRVRIKTSQKLGLAVFLCLSICMIIIAIVRVSGIYYRGKFDNTWIFMWQQVEACIAVTMLSLTAFRSVFVAPQSNANHNKASPWVPSTRRLLGRHEKSKAGGQQRLDDVPIPSATITGLTRVFHRSGASCSIGDLSSAKISMDKHEPSTQI